MTNAFSKFVRADAVLLPSRMRRAAEYDAFFVSEMLERAGKSAPTCVRAYIDANPVLVDANKRAHANVKAATPFSNVVKLASDNAVASCEGVLRVVSHHVLAIAKYAASVQLVEVFLATDGCERDARCHLPRLLQRLAAVRGVGAGASRRRIKAALRTLPAVLSQQLVDGVQAELTSRASALQHEVQQQLLVVGGRALTFRVHVGTATADFDSHARAAYIALQHDCQTLVVNASLDGDLAVGDVYFDLAKAPRSFASCVGASPQDLPLCAWSPVEVVGGVLSSFSPDGAPRNACVAPRYTAIDGDTLALASNRAQVDHAVARALHPATVLQVVASVCACDALPASIRGLGPATALRAFWDLVADDSEVRESRYLRMYVWMDGWMCVCMYIYIICVCAEWRSLARPC